MRNVKEKERKRKNSVKTANGSIRVLKGNSTGSLVKRTKKDREQKSSK